eukprot:scaffold880_cov132-Cylindrotheca_fusiformis.AAC.69
MIDSKNAASTVPCIFFPEFEQSFPHRVLQRIRICSIRRCIPRLLIALTLLLTNEHCLAYHHRYPTYSRRRFLHKADGVHHFRRSIVNTRLGLKSEDKDEDGNTENNEISKLESRLMNRISKLEELVAKQEVELYRLRKTCSNLTATSDAFARVIDLLREAGLAEQSQSEKSSEKSTTKPGPKETGGARGTVVESYDEAAIFGSAPSSVIDAADAAGSAILAGMLGGKKRMLVDVRDAELSSDPETLVQFIELAILPVAAGVEGLESTRNRVKIVFPKVSQLLEYRKTMALAAPEVVALSTLGFDPVEDEDQLVVIVAPSPDDEEGLKAMAELLAPSDEEKDGVQQHVVILNYHMAPVPDLPVKFETAYHLRLLRVQFMSSSTSNDYIQQQFQNSLEQVGAEENKTADSQALDDDGENIKVEDEELEAAMKHAHEVGMNQGLTRAMVIRAYPRPWHLFVDVSPSTDADFEVAGSFVEEPTMEELNFAIVECLEGSEREDEIVAMQMQQALDEGQLDGVTGMIDRFLGDYDDDDDAETTDEENDGDVGKSEEGDDM